MGLLGGVKERSLYNIDIRVEAIVDARLIKTGA